MSTRGEAGKRDQLPGIAAFLGGHAAEYLGTAHHAVGVKTGISAGDEMVAVDPNNAVSFELSVAFEQYDIAAPKFGFAQRLHVQHLAIQNRGIHALPEGFEAERNSGAC